ncbi:MAG: hypothetical protein O7A98_07850, partial [Acidobacteria bacterium]|nr:hypothetical protein [Acidobacteriota bacterium]
FWWHPEHEYAGRMVRFSVSGEAEKGARVRLWYGGDPATLERSFEVLAPALELPARVAAATTLELAVPVRNMSSVPWAATGAFPVTLSYRLLALGDGEASVFEGPRIALPADLPSGDPVTLTLPITWPGTPGKYLLRLDLLIEDYAWFVDRRGESLAEAEIEVVGSL